MLHLLKLSISIGVFAALVGCTSVRYDAGDERYGDTSAGAIKLAIDEMPAEVPDWCKRARVTYGASASVTERAHGRTTGELSTRGTIRCDDEILNLNQDADLYP